MIASTLTVVGSIADICAAIAVAGSFYVFLALMQVLRFRPQPAGGSSREPQPAVTILKPLCGLDPQLYENLRSFCDQDYGDYQVVFGVRDPADPAIPVVQRILGEFPHKDVELVVDPRVRAVNFKVANLMNMLERAKHAVLAIADSDMRVRADYLRNVIAPFDDEGVGAVTMLFGARPVAGLASRLRAMLTNEHFIPSVLVKLSFGKPDIGFGSTLAFARSTLERVGGFEAVGSRLAEDTALTKRIRRLGLDVRVPPYVVQTIESDDARALWDHEMRWTRTIRALAPAGFLGSIVTYPLPFALLFLALSHDRWVGAGVVALVLVLRVMLHYAVRRALQLEHSDDLWLIPLRDCLSAAAWVASFFGQDVRWRDHEFRIHSGDDVTLRGR